MSEFGSQTVGFVTVATSGPPGYLGLQEKTRTVTPLPGCHFRSLDATETPDAATNAATETWLLTAPPDELALAATSSGELVYDGTAHPEVLDLDSPAGMAATFHIDGPIQPKYDLDSIEPHHVVLRAKRQRG